ncbi:thiamine-phosphate synthase family protein [Methanobacterium paludis]|uniref:Phosphomethylpyrimidine kinase n=1 Tax=Methanobacterium paludis (strain DSM 25820 / JCM 18151 / SWAN1) TaxID=868131 RepID=F6D648_METPW|nr:thiamine-phosphate synthase family protein [Methanobacterium paludis]AEG17696.1 Phosphomethylpyrimidine kinase [Methanobacterium paludis]
MEIENIKRAVEILQNSPEFATIIPEVRSNIVMAKENAKDINDVAGIPGRITVVNGKPRAFIEPDFGASSHMARLVLSMMEHDPTRRSALNMKYHPLIIEICEKLGLQVSSYDRGREPETARKVEGGTIPWGVEEAISKVGCVPDVVYHTGSWGKEPIICLIGPDAVEVAEMAVCIAKLFDKYNVQESKKAQCDVPEVPRPCYDDLFAPSRGSYVGKKPHVSCTFCAIAEGNKEVASRVLYRDKNNMVLMNIFPYNRGHIEVVPVKHYTDLNQLDPDELRDIFTLVQRSIKLVREVIKPDGINVGINLGEAAGSSIEHIHIHIVPRFKVESGFMETTADTRVIEESIDDTYTKFMEKVDILRNDHEV